MASIKLKDVKPIDLVRNGKDLLGSAPEKVLKIGLEVEGGWKAEPPGFTRDSSVVFPQDDNAKRALWVDEQMRIRINSGTLLTNSDVVRYRARLISQWNDDHPGSTPAGPSVTGEVPSPILERSKWKEWLLGIYPQFVNKTCGLHVHMSFGTEKVPNNPLLYQRLMVPEYPRTVVEEFIKWSREEKLEEKHPIWERLAGKSEYCQHLFHATAQAAKSGPKEYNHFAPDCRYTVIAYHWNRYGTIECRLLPMFEEPDQSVRAVQRLIDLTDAFLEATRKKEPRKRAILKSTGEEVDRVIERRI